VKAKMRARALVLLFVLTGCTWMRAHSAVTAATVTGTVAGFAACELGDSQGKLSTCLITGGAVGVILGGLALLATTFLDTSANPPPPEPTRVELGNGGAIRMHTRTLPPPVPVDAGVGDAAVTATQTVPLDGATMVPTTPPTDAGLSLDAGGVDAM
jgi:hypothetical protein